MNNKRQRIIYDGDKKIMASNINGYLLDAPDILIEKRAEPICNVPKMSIGSGPIDDGNLIIEADAYEDFIRREPGAIKFIHPYVGSYEFINGKPRYCLWLKDATPNEIASMPLVAERVEAVRQFRAASKRRTTQLGAATPHLFAEDRYAAVRALFVPMVSSENRRYIPIGFIDENVVANNKSLFIAGVALYHFGVLESIVHMAWMRAVCGRLEMRYSYSATIVYNNFPWCPFSDRIERTAQRILDVRSKFADRSLASLYDEETMPKELRAAHEENDLAVLEAYGFSAEMSEAEIVARLMEMYRQFF